MSQGSGDAVLDPVLACPHSLTFRLGVEFGLPNRTPPPLESLLPARYFRLQVASPPPDRIDGSSWKTGLRVFDESANGRDFRDFEENDSYWKEKGVFALGGISSLDQPLPEKLVLDTWLAVPAVHPSEALTRAFDLTAPDKPTGEPINHFLSARYPQPIVEGRRLGLASVSYYWEGELPLTGDVGNFIAVSLDAFQPPDRFSVDYIVAVDQECPHMGSPEQRMAQQRAQESIVKSWG
jgi:hypothetical protein